MKGKEETSEDYVTVINCCGVENETIGKGDEFWDYCPECECIEQGTTEITLEEYENNQI